MEAVEREDPRRYGAMRRNHPNRGAGETFGKLTCPAHTASRSFACKCRAQPNRKRPLLLLSCSARRVKRYGSGAAPLPEGEVTCPSCRYNYDLKKGSVPQKGKFQCSCGQTDDIIASIRTLAQDQRLPIRPYAVQAYLPLAQDKPNDDRQPSFFEDGNIERLNDQHQPHNLELPDGLKGNGFLTPDNGKFFKRFTVADMRQLQQAETLWSQYQGRLPYPKSAIQRGAETNRLLEHHYNKWADMFAPRQMLALTTLMQGIMAEEDQTLREMLLCAFSATLNNSNMFSRCHRFTYREGKVEGVFARHHFRPKITPLLNRISGVSFIDTGPSFKTL